MFKYNDKYIEKISMLGEIDEINDEIFFIIFQPHNGLGAKVTTHDGVTDLSIMKISEYEPLIMQTSAGHQYWNLAEEEAVEILINYFKKD